MKTEAHEYDYSHSRLRRFDDCPGSYYKRYVLKEKEAPSPGGSATGLFLHAAIAEYDRHLYGNNIQTDITAIPEIARLLFERAEYRITPEEYADSRDILERYAGSHILNRETLVGIEEEIVAVHEGTGRRIIAILDRLHIDGTRARITDYKSDWRVRTHTEVEKDPQLHTYAWAVTQAYPQIEEVEAELDFIRFNAQVKTTIDRADIERTSAALGSRIARIDGATKYPFTPGAGCQFCGYAHSCPALKELGLAVINEPEDAATLAKELAYLERLVEDRKAALKQWTNIRGPVLAAGKSWGYHTTISTAITDSRAFSETITEAGQDPHQYLNVDMRKAAKFLKNAALFGELERRGALEQKASSRFDGKKATGGETNAN